MKIKLYISLIFIILFFNCSVSYADSTESYRKFCTLVGVYDTEEHSLTSCLYGHDAINYAVEILKNDPNSIEACEIIELFNRTLNDDKTLDFYNKLQEKHMPHFEDPDYEPAEKLLFLRGLSSVRIVNNLEENKQNQKLSNKGFINMKDNCKDPDYAALATKGLFFVKNNEERLGYTKYFFEKYPKHKYIPIIELCLINEQYCKSDPQKCIEELLKLSQKYKNFITPHGWRFVMDLYCNIAYSYMSLNDYKKARQYYYMIEKEAPNYYNLKYLKSRLFNEELE